MSYLWVAAGLPGSTLVGVGGMKVLLDGWEMTDFSHYPSTATTSSFRTKLSISSKQHNLWMLVILQLHDYCMLEIPLADFTCIKYSSHSVDIFQMTEFIFKCHYY